MFWSLGHKAGWRHLALNQFQWIAAACSCCVRLPVVVYSLRGATNLSLV